MKEAPRIIDECQRICGAGFTSTLQRLPMGWIGSQVNQHQALVHMASPSWTINHLVLMNIVETDGDLRHAGEESIVPYHYKELSIDGSCANSPDYFRCTKWES